MKKIGIIGGNGVAATIKLQNIIEEKLTKNGAFRDFHHPELIVWQATKAPSRSMFLEGKGESFIPDYKIIGEHLKSCGATKLCMCCNTAHFAIDTLQKAIDLPFINLIEETVKEVKNKAFKKIGIMASDGNVQHKLYDTYFTNLYSSAQFFYPHKEHQALLTQGICNVKNNKRFLPFEDAQRPKNLFAKVVDEFLSQKCDCVILACTDISIDFDFTREYPIEIIDSLDVLANCIIKESQNEQSIQ